MRKNIYISVQRRGTVLLGSLALVLLVAGIHDHADAAVSDVTLSANPASPQLVNTPVTFTATATGGGTDKEYEFAVKDPVIGVMTVMQPYGSSNSFSYTPTNAGTYSIRTFVRNVGSPAAYEASLWYAYNVTVAAPVTGVTLVASPASPQLVNTPVTFTAMATGGTGTVEYEFAVMAPGSGVMTILQLYSLTNIFPYTPTIGGGYSVRAYARHVGSPAAYEATRLLVYNVNANPVIEPNTSLSSMPPVPDGANGWFKTIPIITLASNVLGTTYYHWGLDQYDLSRQSQEWTSGGTPLNIIGDDIGDWYDLPFGFALYGTNYSRVFLSTNGVMSFVAENEDFYDEEGLSNKVAVVAPLWDDLRTDMRSGDDIYVFQPDAESVGFRWQAVTYVDEKETNFEAILYRDGRIRFNYGAQMGGLYGTIGISKGDGTNYVAIYDGDISSTNNIDSVVFVPRVNSWEVYTGPFAAPNGENTLYYYSADDSGYSEVTQHRIFKVDTTMPVVNITSPMTGFTNNNTPLFSYTLNKAVAAATVTIDGMTVDKTPGDLLDQLQVGQHTVTVTVDDYAGNTAFDNVVFTVVSTAPTVSIISPAAGITTNNMPLLSYAVNYGTVTVLVDGVAVSKASGDNLDVLADGSHTVRVESVDASGYATSAEVKFIVDVTPPLASSISNFTSIAAGDSHSIGITADGTLWQWGATLDASLPPGEGGSWASVTFPARISADHSWKSVAAGLSSNLAIKTDGTLWAWGTNGDGQLGLGDDTGADIYTPVQIGTDSDWKAVATGGRHSLGLKTDGTLWAWGYGWHGQLGIGGQDTLYAPVQVGYDGDWSAISAGGNHSIAIKSNGTLWAWGNGGSGQLGYGDGEDHFFPVQIGAADDWTAISAGYNHTVALKSIGELWAWGANFQGQLGDGSGIDQYAPLRIETTTDWAAISAGDGYTMALKANGTLWAWGWNGYGQLGDGTTYDKNVPEQIGDWNTWSAAVAGVYHAMSLKSDGTLWTWGRNEYGQLGDGTTQNRTVPHFAFSVSDAIVINNGAVSTNSTSAILTLNAWDLTSGVTFMQFSNDGTAWLAPEPYATTKDWVLDSQNGTKTVYAMFQDAAGNWSSVYNASIFMNAGPTEVIITSPAAGFTTNNTPPLSFTVNKMDAAITVRIDGVVVNKTSGDILDVLPEGTHTVRVEAVDVNGISGAKEVSFTVDILPPTVTLTSPATGLTNNSMPLLSYTVNKAMATTVVKVDGIVVNKVSGDTLDALADGAHRLRVDVTDIYGYHVFAEVAFTVDATPPSATSYVKFSAIDAGGHHAAAIASNGTLWTWGLNTYGQLGDDTKISRLTPTLIGTGSVWTSVSAGDWHTVAIKSDGSSWAWGNNYDGTLGTGGFNGEQKVPVPVGTDKDWVSVSAGSKHTEAIKSDSSIWAWGSDWEGALGAGGHGDQYAPTWGGTLYLSAEHLSGGDVVSAGNNFTLLLLSDGSLWTAGANAYGELGDGRVCLEERIDFWRVGTDTDWAAISAGGIHAVALKTDGSLWGWGNGTRTPTRMGTGTNWAAISAGSDHTVALKSDGTLWVWGISVTDIPVQIGIDTDWAAISAGSGFSLALKTDGSLWTWGINTYGQLGDGTTESHALPQQVDVVVGSNNPILINGGASSTGSQFVTLSLFAWDGRSGTVSMKLKNEDADWTEPEPYATTKAWTLSPNNGFKTVSVMFQDTAGNWSSIYSASITLIQGSPSVTITSPAAGPTKNAVQQLSYTVSEGAVVVKVDGTAVSKVSGNMLDTLADGEHSVRVEATNASGTGFDEVIFTIDTVAPVVSISSPVAGTSKNRTPQLTYTFSDGTVIVKVDGVIVSKVSGDLLNSLSDGSHTVQVQATDTAGNVGSAEVSFTVDNTPPSIEIVSPVAGVTNLTSLPLIYNVSDGAVTVTVDGNIVSMVSGDLLSSLPSGSHTVTVSAIDAAGNNSSEQVDFTVDITAAGNDDTNIYCRGTGTYVVGPSNFTSGISVPTGGNAVLIASPYDGATINGSKIIVKGAMDTTVPVNSVMIVVSNTTGTAGYFAQVNGNYFAAKVSVTADTHTITAIATDQTGTQHQTSVSVTVNAQTGSIDLLATPGTGIPLPKQGGTPSLDVSLMSKPTITSPVNSFAWDFDGSGSDDLTCYSHSSVKASYQQTGLYLTKIAIADSQGNTFTDIAIVNVVDRNQMDAVFKPIWNGMKNALKSGDAAGALNYILPASRQKYSNTFIALQANISEIANGMQDIELAYVSDTVARYRIRRDHLVFGQYRTITYYIYYRKDQNGQWMIDEF